MKKYSVIYNQENEESEPDIAATDEETVFGAEKIFAYLQTCGFAEIIPMQADNYETKMNRLDKNSIVVNYCEWSGNNYRYAINLLKYLEENNYAYTGGSWKDFLWSADKLLMRDLFINNKFPILNSRIFGTDQNVSLSNINYPAIVKTTREHCSIGLDDTSVVSDEVQAIKKATSLSEKYQQPVMIEEFAEGNEYQLFVFSTDRGLVTLPVYETIYNESNNLNLISYAENWTDDELSKKIKKIGITEDKKKNSAVTELGIEMFKTLNMRGYCRMDFREKGADLKVLEINVNPSIAWTDEFDFISVCGTAAGLNFNGIVDLVISGALV
jgi:D-alanine-D-alanine ligase